jgi:methylamine dehydrogenase heavy chain
MPEPLESVSLPEKPRADSWVWLGDFQAGNYARALLYDVGTGTLLGTLDTGWEGIKLDFPRNGDEIYNLAMYMSRAFRGERVDAITAYDRHTLKPMREIVVPPKGIHGWPDVNHTALSDDDRFMWMQFMTPASSLGIADLKAGKYVGEIETSGCAHVMAAGPRQAFTLCGDGSALALTIGDDGREVARKRYSGFFDVAKDPLHGSGTRSGNTWYFVSHRGQVHELEVGSGELKPGVVWTIAEKIGDKTWVPSAPMQPVAVHGPLKRLYVLMHPSDLKPKGGGTDFHREDGEEVWVFDLTTHQRLKRMALQHPGTALAVSEDPSPVVYVTAMMHLSVIAYDEASGKVKREFQIPTYPALIQPAR